MRLLKAILAIYLITLNSHLSAQKKDNQIIYPEIDKPCPDLMVKNVEYFTKKEVRISDFKGKWLVVDFWTKYCGACVNSFPKIDSLQKEFKDKLQFLLIGLEDKEQKIRPMFAKFKEK